MKKINKKMLCILGVFIFLICAMGYILTQTNESTGSDLQDSSSNLENENTTEDSLDTNQLEWDYIEEPSEEMKEELEKSEITEATSDNSSAITNETTKKAENATNVTEKISENTTADSEEKTESTIGKNEKSTNQNKKTIEEITTAEKPQNTQQKTEIKQEQNSFSNKEEDTTMYELPMDVFDE